MARSASNADRVRVEILYTEGCGHLAVARGRVEALAAGHAIPVLVKETLVRTPDEAAVLGFAGSPTILVEGRDVANGAGGATGHDTTAGPAPTPADVGLG